jgi:hypothetical protein
MFLAAKTALDISRSLANISGKQPSILSSAPSSGTGLGVLERELGKASGSRPVILETDRRFAETGDEVARRE